MKKFASLILALGLSLVAMAQNIPFKGVVLDGAGEPVVGAFVVEQGTQNGTMTGIVGDFSLNVRQGAVVEVSCLGYATRTVTVSTPQESAVIVLEDDTQMLEETVVIGYGVQKKSVVTASIAKVDSEALGLTAPTRVDNALKGLTGTKKYESVNAGGSVAFASTGMALDGTRLTHAADEYLFTVSAANGKYTIRNVATGTYLDGRTIVGEVLRSGVNAVPRGQTEAALSLGMRDGAVFFKIVFPQALRYVVPALISEIVIVLKDTTFAYVVSYADLMQNAKVLISNYDAMLSVYVLTALLYIAVNYVLNALSARAARRGLGRNAA